MSVPTVSCSLVWVGCGVSKWLWREVQQQKDAEGCTRSSNHSSGAANSTVPEAAAVTQLYCLALALGQRVRWIALCHDLHDVSHLPFDEGQERVTWWLYFKLQDLLSIVYLPQNYQSSIYLLAYTFNEIKVVNFLMVILHYYNIIHKVQCIFWLQFTLRESQTHTFHTLACSL